MQDDEADDSDRLVIDEEQYSNSELISGASAKNEDSHENELPECQGCKKREAQFVCADCQRQWYCSRECQVRHCHSTSISMHGNQYSIHFFFFFV